MPAHTLHVMKVDHRRRRLPLSCLIPAVLVALCLAGGPRLAWGEAPDCALDSSCIAPNSRPTNELFQPYVIRSENDLKTELSVKYFENVGVGNEKFGLRMYGYPNPKTGPYACGTENAYCYTLPGPTYRIKKGHTYYLKLKNQLGKAPRATEVDGCNEDNKHNDEAPNCFNGNNITNFHFHGFHISPQPPHDNIFLKLKVGEEYDLNSGVIPDNQAEGTHWYHPHHHGATALQVMNGMAGAFLVEGKFDEELEELFAPNVLEEKVLVLQQVASVIVYPNGGKTSQFVVNGQLDPELSIGEGEIERWRLVNANGFLSASDTFIFPEEMEVKQIAMDGVQFAPENYRDQPLLKCDADGTSCSIDLSPGNRADFLVKGTGKTGKVRAKPLNLQSFSKEMKARKNVRKITKHPLFHITVDRTYRKTEMDFPPVADWPDLPNYLRNVDEIDRDREIAFSAEGASPSIEFYIDDRQFNRACVDQRMKLGDSERWTFTNTADQGTPIAHPAHIHVNPFQVWVRNGVKHPNDFPIWQDTIALPTNGTETVIRQRYEDFEGMFVMHCHILGHEDRGMMQTLEIGSQSGCELCPQSEPTAQCNTYRDALAAGKLP